MGVAGYGLRQVEGAVWAREELHAEVEARDRSCWCAGVEGEERRKTCIRQTHMGKWYGSYQPTRANHWAPRYRSSMCPHTSGCSLRRARLPPRVVHRSP